MSATAERTQTFSDREPEKKKCGGAEARYIRAARKERPKVTYVSCVATYPSLPKGLQAAALAPSVPLPCALLQREVCRRGKKDHTVVFRVCCVCLAACGWGETDWEREGEPSRLWHGRWHRPAKQRPERGRRRERWPPSYMYRAETSVFRSRNSYTHHSSPGTVTFITDMRRTTD